ncbi:MAG: hypothetical protein MPI93_07100, partial [Nitrosopumilus sp.]|nr:hypothetical protein [Nitrosopumilus sp.]
TFGGFGGTAMRVDGVAAKQARAEPKPAAQAEPKPSSNRTSYVPPKPKSKKDELAAYEADYVKRVAGSDDIQEKLKKLEAAKIAAEKAYQDLLAASKS